jgi:hypothetical protein
LVPQIRALGYREEQMFFLTRRRFRLHDDSRAREDPVVTIRGQGKSRVRGYPSEQPLADFATNVNGILNLTHIRGVWQFETDPPEAG